MKAMMFGVVVAVAMMAGGAGAQSGGTMSKDDKMGVMDHMGGKPKPMTLTGCVEAGGTAHTFALTHAMADQAMAMGKKGMGKDSMSKDSMAKDSMAKDSMAKDGMKKDAMAPATFALMAPAIDLSKHVGQKVSVTGTSDGHTVTATAVKMLASNCS